MQLQEASNDGTGVELGFHRVESMTSKKSGVLKTIHTGIIFELIKSGKGTTLSQKYQRHFHTFTFGRINARPKH